jgi:hypothetical protein
LGDVAWSHLHELVHIVETGDVRRAVADDEVGVLAVEVGEHLVHLGEAGDVALNLHDALDGGHGLEVDGDDLRKVVGGDPRGDRGEVHLAAQHLAPAPGRRAQVHHVLDPAEDVEAVVDLQQLEGASRAPTLFFRLAVVDVALIFGALTHLERRAAATKVGASCRALDE